MCRLWRLGAVVVLGVAMVARAQAAPSCPSYPPVPVVSSVAFYTDSHGSISDPAKVAEHARRLRPITDFMTYLETVLDAEPTPGSLDCPYALLRHWAAAGAILRPSPDTPGRVQRAFYSTGFGVIVLKFHHRGVTITPDVAHWLAELAAAERRDYAKFRGNVYPFTGATAALSALVSDDPESLRYQDEVWQTEIGQIHRDGTIPAELARAGRALVYHQTAASGLLVLHAARVALGRHDDPALLARLRLLLDMIGTALCHPEKLAASAGAAQEIPGPWGFRLAAGFGDGLVPDTWITCGPKVPQFVAVDTGGDSRVAAAAIRDSPRRKR